MRGVGKRDCSESIARGAMMLAILVFIGAEANTGWLEGAVELDERGFILTERALERSALEENVWRGLSR